MPFFALYLIKLTISLSFVWLFYQLLLRRLTFYGWNRWYLLGYSLLSFFIPLIDIQPWVAKDPLSEPEVIRYIPTIGDYPGIVAPTVAGVGSTHNLTGGIGGWSILLIILALGSAILLIILVSRWVSLQRVRRKGMLISEISGGIRIYQVDAPIVPFSFGNAVYINRHLHTEKEWEEIILHEYVHIRQRHTADILVAEWLCIVNWFNPFVWLIRHAIRQNLEFIADSKVLENGVDKKAYQYHLLKVIGEPRYRLANNFNFSSLKRRITMMNRMKSARLQLVKFLFMLPLLATLLVAFRGQVGRIFKDHSGIYLNATGIIVAISDYHPLAGVAITDKRSGLKTVTDERGFYKLQIPVEKNDIHVHLAMFKPGFDSNYSEYFIPDIKEPIGRIEIGYLATKADTHWTMFMGFIPSRQQQPVDPTYQDALQVLQKVRHNNEDMDAFFKMQKQHPEVSLFYTAEDHKKQIVIYKDGHFEKYGYPDGPPVADMEKKFGRLADMITGKQGSAGGYYIERWGKISAQAENEFHTTNPDARHIIFPGDSRVIAVPVNGKPVIYDMDNSDPTEKPAFEKLYGKLPACVPEPPAKTSSVNMPTPTRTDTVPAHTNASKDNPHPRSVGLYGIASNILYIVDGVKMPEGWLLDSLAPNNIASIDIIKNPDSLRKYGPLGANGVIIVSTKTPPAILHFRSSPPQKPPIYVVDGIEVSDEGVQKMSPENIFSISILKGEGAITKYGEKGRNGVVEITTKKKGDSMNQHMMIVDPSAMERMTSQADTIRWKAIKKGVDPTIVYFIDRLPMLPKIPLHALLSNQDIAVVEISLNEDLLRRYGLQPNQQIFNYVTKAHKDDPKAHIFEQKEMFAASIETERRQNMLYTGTDNLLKIESPGVSPDDLVVTIPGSGTLPAGGTIEKKNGLFYAKVTGSGNIPVSLYKKEKDGKLTLLDLRYFRIAPPGSAALAAESHLE